MYNFTLVCRQALHHQLVSTTGPWWTSLKSWANAAACILAESASGVPTTAGARCLDFRWDARGWLPGPAAGRPPPGFLRGPGGGSARPKH